MKISKKLLVLPMLAAGLLVSCSSTKEPITSSPSPYVLTPEDGVAKLDLDFNIPKNYVSKRSRIFITPELVEGDSVIDRFDPLVLDASIFSKKTLRKKVLHGYVDPWAPYAIDYRNTSKSHTIHYSNSIDVSEEADGARIIAVVSKDGCGRCTGIDTLDVGRISYPPIVINSADLLRNAWIEPEFVVREKLFQGKGEAKLQFVVNKWDIVMDMADNRSELTGMLRTLRPILSDTLATVTSLNIFGSASAEGAYKHNVMLANNRANAAKNWLSSELDLPAKVRNIIRVGAAPEGWEPVVQAMIAANDPDSVKVRELMKKYPGPTDDAAEAYIRRLEAWPRIKDKYLAKDRKVTYDYTWTVRNFTTDKEMLDMYAKRPDALNEDEFLHVASLAKDNASKGSVYENMLTYFPESAVAKSNLAYLYVEEGKNQDAIDLLLPVKTKTPEMLNIMAAAYINQGDDLSAIDVLENIDTPEARETLTLLKKKQNRKNKK